MEYKVSELAIKTRRQQKIWMRCIGKCVQAIANLNDIEYRIEKPSRHETHDWRSKRVIVHDNQSLGGSGDKFSRRRPTLENLDDAAIARANGQTPPTPHEYPKSISKHATDQKWTLSENNFYKTPARPRTQTTAPPIPDSLFGSVYKNDLDNILIFLEGHRQFDSLEGRAGDKLLHTACVSGQLSLVVFFTDKGAKVTGMDGYGESKHATDQKWTLSENNFYKTPARPRTQTTAPPIPDSLFGSVYKNDLDNILIFLEGHRQFDSLEGRAGDKLLHTACVSGQLSLVVFFTDKGAKVTGMDGYGESPLYCAVKGRHVKVSE